MAQTLLSMSGANLAPTPLSGAILVLIDIQNEYFDGPLALTGVEAATGVAQSLLQRARAQGTPVIHVRHRGKTGGAFDPDAPRGAIHDSVAPIDGETVIDKALPNAYTGTLLAEALAAYPDRSPIFAGFMTHMCLSSTVRAALDHGVLATVAMDAAATRDLPDPMGGTIPAAALHQAALAELADRFAVLSRGADIPD